MQSLTATFSGKKYPLEYIDNTFISNMNAGGFIGFADTRDYSYAYIENSNITSDLSTFILSGNSEISVRHSAVKNTSDFQYAAKESAHLSLKNSKINCDSCFSLSRYSEIQTQNCAFNVKNESIVSKEFSVIVNNNSRWNIMYIFCMWL